MLYISASHLKTAIKLLPGLGNKQAPGAAHTYIRLRQLTTEILVVDSVGMEGIYTEVSIPSTATIVGQELLIPYAELVELLSRTEDSYLMQMYLDVDTVSIDTYLECRQDVPVILDTNKLPAFCGAASEFLTPKIGPTQLEISCASVAETLSRTIAYGDYTNYTGGHRAILIELQAESLIIYGTPLAVPNFYYKQVIGSRNQDPFEQIAILSYHLAQIKTAISNSEGKSTWSLHANWLCVSTDVCKLSVPLQDLDRHPYLKPVSEYHKELMNQKPQVAYTLPLERTIAALKAQQPVRSNNRYLKLSAIGAQLKVAKAADLLDREWSKVDLLDLWVQEGIAIPEVAVNGPALLKSVTALLNVAKTNKLSADLMLALCRREINGNEKWVCSISLTPNEITESNILCPANV